MEDSSKIGEEMYGLINEMFLVSERMVMKYLVEQGFLIGLFQMNGISKMLISNHQKVKN